MEDVVIVGTSLGRIATSVTRREQHHGRTPCGIFPNVVATANVFAWHSKVRRCMALDPDFYDYTEDFVPNEPFLLLFIGRSLGDGLSLIYPADVYAAARVGGP